MYCISRIDSTLARMIRDARGTIGMEIAMITLWMDGPSAADITSANTSNGNPWRISSSRWAIRSVLPPAYPDNRPMMPPSTEPSRVEPMPTMSDTRAPCTSREYMSRPR